MHYKKRVGWPWDQQVASVDYDKSTPWPKISIVTPSYNQADFLEKTILSVLNQNYPNLEYIIMDGGSKDGSVEIIKKYASRITYWVSEKDSGQTNALNKGFSKCTGEIYHWLNSDDYLLPNALLHMGSFEWKPNVGAVVGRAHRLNLEGKIIKTPKIPDVSTNGLLRWSGYGSFLQPGCFFSAEAWKMCGPMNERLNYCMDLDLWLKIAGKFDLVKMDQDIAHAYAHEDAKTTYGKEQMKIEVSLIVTLYGGFEIAREVLYKQISELVEIKTQFRMIYKLINLLKRLRSKLRKKN